MLRLNSQIAAFYCFFSIAFVFSASATDLTIGKILSPVPTETLKGGEQISVRFEVRNINILPAEAYTCTATISPAAGGSPVYTGTASAGLLAPGATAAITMENKWLTTVGSFRLTVSVSYSEDIDHSNDSKEMMLAVSSCCFSEDNWRRGPSMKIVRNIEVFPSGEQLGRMRPGDVIAVSALVEDMDMLEQKCKCPNGDDTLTTNKFHGPYRDDLIYDWSLSGPGTLIQSTAKERRTVLYELPLCDTTPAILRCVVRNTSASGKAIDDTLVGGITFRQSVGAKLPSVGTNEIGAARFLSVTTDIMPFVQRDDEILSEISETKCKPDPPQWLEKTAFSGGFDIQTAASELTCPDYLMLLSAERNDLDSVALKCVPGSPDPCAIALDSPGKIQTDALTYTWRLVGGKGSFPLGNTGQTVVFWRSKTDTAMIECEIADSRAQFPDQKTTLKRRIGKSRNPKAYVGIGDISYEKLWINWGDNAQLEEAAVLAGTFYTNAGYDVVFDAQAALIPTNQGILREIRDPCTQAVWVIGHGSNEDNQNKGTIELTDDKNFAPHYVYRAANDAFKCPKHPLLREMVLMGCYTGRAKWGNTVFSARVYGFPGALINARWFVHEVLNWEKNQHWPPNPHDLRMP